MTLERIWLDVPFDEKDEAKALGARWDSKAKRWYAPSPTTELERWTALPDIPHLLPSEDRSFGSGLFVDLVPSSCWFTNVRSCVAPKDWERLRRMITGRAEKRCEACGNDEDRQAQRWLEAHERWSYDEQNSVQSLQRLVCLCTSCHTTTHFGLAQIKGKDVEARDHLCKVTGMSLQQADAHIKEAFSIWKERSARQWTLNLDILTSAGVTVIRPPAAAVRVGIAREKLLT
jgi:hypothetical protein